MKTNYWILFLSTCFFSSCASTFQSINPQQLTYLNNNPSEGIEFSFSYDVLTHKKNKNFKKKESKNNVQLVAVKIKNTSDKVLYFGKNLKLFSENTAITPLPPPVVAQQLKQPVGPYFLYLLLSPVKLYVDNGRERENYPIGLVAGPVLALGTFSAAQGGNKKLAAELLALDPTGKAIEPGDTLAGLIGINGQQPIPLQLQIIE